MKKIFTLISMALVAMSVNAQTESYTAIGEDGTLASEFQNATLEGTDLIATISGTHVTVKGLSSKTPKDLLASNGYTDSQSFDNTNWPEWDDATWLQANKNKEIWYYDTDGTTKIHAFQFRSVWGKGNPVTGWKSKVVMTANAFNKLTADYEGFYFVPGVSTKTPVSGEYFEFKADVDGMFRIGFYISNGTNRYMYIVDKDAVRTLSKSEYKVEGYVNGCDNKDGSPMFIPSIQVNDDYSIGSTEFKECYSYGTKCDGIDTYEEDGETKTRQPVNQLNQPKYGWFVFNAQANKSYQIFCPNTQFGFRSYEFTPGTSIENYIPVDPNPNATAISTVKAAEQNADAPVYNLAGQKVDKSFKGVVIQNGVKRIQK